jgi:ATP-dependent DNA helicase RecQ
MNAQPLASHLKQTFGYGTFRPLQREIMDATLAGQDVLAVLPTGAGKSLCYQLPALVRGGLTIVVSPLIALMKDQVDQLLASGVSATFLNSTLAADEASNRLTGLDKGKYQLLYVAPERLMLLDFLGRLKGWNVYALAVDEAHCISEWGHDFRPEYRRIKEVRQWTGPIPVLALTATATKRVRADIVKQLELNDPTCFLASFNRPNLKYQVIPKSGAVAQICNFVNARPDDSGIIYCQSRKNTEALASTLRSHGFSAVAYHAGLDAVEREKNQDAFLRDRAKIVCATVAFGMGINKPNVRYVIHADLPKNVEGYYQETGRAGRDGLPADCLLLFSRGDFMKYIRFLDEIPDEQTRQVAHQQLDQMVHFAENETCRRVGLLGYFGEIWTLENCGACDHCLAPREKWDATIDVQKLLSCVLRIRQAGNFSVGLNHVVEVLTGGMSEKIVRWNHDRLKTHGIGKEHPRPYWTDLGRQLTRNGLLLASEDRFPTISVTRSGINLLKSRATIWLTRSMTPANDRAVSPSSVRAGEIPCDTALFEDLRVLRKELADARNIPPYVVFSDVTLRHLCRNYPQDEDSLVNIPGVGEKKRADYGKAFLNAIRNWLVKHSRMEFEPLIKSPKTQSSAATRNKYALTDTAKETLNLWKSGKSIHEIAVIRSFKDSTIEGHLAEAIATGEQIDPRAFYSEDEEREMRAALEGYNEISLKPVFDRLEGRISYGKLKFYRAATPILETDDVRSSGALASLSEA